MPRSKAETMELPKGERWTVLKACGMDGDHVEWEEITPQAAQEMVEKEPKKYLGYIVDEEDDEGVFICTKGGIIYSKENGIEDTWTLHLYRTSGLPARPAGGLFTDDFRYSKQNGEQRRVSRGEGLADQDVRVSLFGSIDPHDLQQGAVGNCWLISAFSAAAEFPKIVTALCHQQGLDVNGRYDVRLFHPVKEQWSVVHVDDSFPVKNGKLKYAAMSTENEIWPCVVEKAIAKMFGGYDELNGNTSLMALKTLCGGELLSFEREDDGWACYKPVFEALDDTSNFPAPWPDGFGSGSKLRPFDDKFFELIEDLDETGCIMCCAAGSHESQDAQNLKQSKGRSGEMCLAFGTTALHGFYGP